MLDSGKGKSVCEPLSAFISATESLPSLARESAGWQESTESGQQINQSINTCMHSECYRQTVVGAEVEEFTTCTDASECCCQRQKPENKYIPNAVLCGSTHL